MECSDRNAVVVTVLAVLSARSSFRLSAAMRSCPAHRRSRICPLVANSSAHWRSVVLPSLKVLAAARIRAGGVPSGSTGVARHSQPAGRDKLKSYEMSCCWRSATGDENLVRVG